MESKAYYIKRILKTIGIGLLGLLIAQVLFASFPLYEGSVFMTTLLFAGLPFGWTALRRVFGGMILWGIWGTIFYYVLMLAVSFAIGWMILCYRLIKDTVQLAIVWYTQSRAAANM